MKVYLAVSLLLALIAGLSSRAVVLEKGGNVGDIWSNCGSASDVAKLNSVIIKPDPPEKGKPISVTANVTTSSSITGGSVKVELKWGFITVLDQSFDLCELLKNASLSCPLAAGTYSASQSVSLPGEAPSGHYKGSAVGTGADGKRIFCIDLDFRL